MFMFYADHRTITCISCEDPFVRMSSLKNWVELYFSLNQLSPSKKFKSPECDWIMSENVFFFNRSVSILLNEIFRKRVTLDWNFLFCCDAKKVGAISELQTGIILMIMMMMMMMIVIIKKNRPANEQFFHLVFVLFICFSFFSSNSYVFSRR